MLRFVKCERQYAHVAQIVQENTESKINVMTVFPPERIVKYIAFKNPCKGKNDAVTIIKAEFHASTQDEA